MTDVLTLTAYLAERERRDGRFLTEVLLDLFAEHGVRSSIQLRGIASFGPRNIVRTDESLSLSEDLPVTLAAVDTPEVIAPLADRAAGLLTRGLLTLERARLVEQSFTDAAATVRLTAYLRRRDDHVAACAVLHRLGFAGAIVYLGVDGTVAGQRCRAGFLSRNREVPVVLLGVGMADRAAAAATELRRLLPHALLTVERIRVCKRAGTLLAQPHQLPATDAEGRPLFGRLTVVTDENSLHDGQPIHRALVRRLRESAHASGATVLRGLWGFSDDRAPHGDRMLALSRRVPVVTVVVDTPERIALSFAIVDELTHGDGLVTSEIVPAALMIDGDRRAGGTTLARLPHDQR